MPIGVFFSGLFKFLGNLFGWLQQDQLIKTGESKVIAVVKEKEVEILNEAITAREEARAANSIIPEHDSLPDDGFRRD